MSPGLISVWMVATPSPNGTVGCGIGLSDTGKGKETPVDNLWLYHTLYFWLVEPGLAGDVTGYTARVRGMWCPVPKDRESSTEGSGLSLTWEDKNKDHCCALLIQSSSTCLTAPVPSPAVHFTNRQFSHLHLSQTAGERISGAERAMGGLILWG